MSYDLYVKDAELVNSLCVNKVGDMVTIRKDLYDELGVFHKGTAFRIEKIAVNPEAKVRRVLSSEINNYEADPRIFIYDLSIPDTGIEIKKVNSEHFHEAHNKLNALTLWTWAIAVVAVIILLHLSSKGDDMITIIGITMMITIAIFITIPNGVFEKPNIYKKH